MKKDYVDYVDFEEVRYNLKDNPQKLTILIENRQKLKWREYGIHNHGELLNMRNKADDDLWDVVIPAYSYRINPGTKHNIGYIYGVFWIGNGNHKIFCSQYIHEGIQPIYFRQFLSSSILPLHNLCI